MEQDAAARIGWAVLLETGTIVFLRLSNWESLGSECRLRSIVPGESLGLRLDGGAWLEWLVYVLQ